MKRNTTRTGLARKQRHHRYQIRQWVDRLPDVPAFIIGNSPSIKELDVPIRLLENWLTVGINRCFYIIDPTILLWQDLSLWNSEYHKLHNTQSIKVSRDVSDPRKIYYNFYLKGGGYHFNPKSAHILYGRGNTGPLAVQLAVAMGCRPIVLIGMDCKKGKDGQTNFYGTNKHWTDATQANCLLGLRFIHEQCPVEVRNCGTSDFWPTEKLEDVLESLDKSHFRSRQSYVKQILGLSNS